MAMQMKHNEILSRSRWLLAAVLCWPLAACSATCIQGSGTVVMEQRVTGEFRRVHVDGSMDVLVVRPEELTPHEPSGTLGRGQISIETDDNLLEHYTTEVRGDQLFIDTAKMINCISSTRGVTIRIAPSELVEVTIDGSGSLTSNLLHAGEHLRVSVDGSGDVIMTALQLNRLDAEVDGSGDLKLAGMVQSMDCLVDGSGKVHASDLVAHRASVEIDGSGDVELAVEQELNATIDGSGKLLYRGDPTGLNTRISGSGDVIKRN